MSLSPPSCPDRAGLARSHATRSGYPVNVGRKVLLYALSNVARSNATRSNYTSGIAFISIGGIQVGGGGVATPGSPRILHDTLSITDALNETPNTATCTMHFGAPAIGQPVSVAIGSINNSRKEFTGTVLACRSYYIDTPANPHFDLNIIDDTPGLNTRKVWEQFATQTVSTIATTLVTTYAPSYSLLINASIGAISIDAISFADRDLTDCLTQLMKRAGSNWRCDYGKKVVIGPDSRTPPRIIDAVHPSLLTIDVSRDYSQVVTRVLSEGGGGQLLQQMTPGETIMPLDTGVWYEPTGIVTIGAQRITYTAVELPSGGTLVGPGAAPTAALVAQLAPGSGVTDGPHDYAVGFVTASGESLQGPRTTITVGPLAAPGPPTAGTPIGGTGPNPGVHSYAVSFVTASGETLPGAVATVATGITPAPTDAPTTNPPTVGGSIDAGAHDYAVTFVTATGETTPSPISGQQTTGGTITTGTLSPPSSAPGLGTAVPGTAIHSNNTYQWAQTFLTATGETTASPVAARSQAPQTVTPPATAPTLTEGGFVAGQQWGLLTASVAVTFYGQGETTISPIATLTFTSTTTTLNLSNIPLGPVGTIMRRIYYHENTRPNEVWRKDINDNTSTTYATLPPPYATGTTLDNTTGQMGPVANTDQIWYWAVPITLQTGPAGVTGRRLYRTTETDGTLRRVVTLNDNTTTAYTDALSDASLASQPAVPAFNTATISGIAGTIPLTAIPKGDASVTSKKLYRRSGGAGLRFLASITAGATTYTDTAANSTLGAAPPASSTATLQQIPLSGIAIGGPLVTARKVWGTAAGLSQLKLVATIADNSTTTYTVTTPDASLGANAPVSNTAFGNQVALSGIPLGAGSVTQRKVYRTAAGTTTPLKLLTTLADNTTTTYTDALPDASLGANAPASDTSGLQQPSGAVLAGSPSIIVAGAGAFKAAGGWAVIGNGEQVIRYTAISGNTLTGIPASGIGSIVASIAYNSTITSPAHLRGVPVSGPGAIRFLIPRGEPVNLLVIENDIPAQTALAALLGTDGIQEDSLSDNRLGAPEARARARAWLAVRKDPEVSVRAETRDRNTASGLTLTVNLGLFGLASVPFLIQSVTEHTFTPALQPHFSLQASTVRFTFEDWQRMIKEGID